MSKDKERKQRLADHEMTLKTIFLMRKHLMDWLHQVKHTSFYVEANEILIDVEQKIWEEIVYGDDDPKECENSDDVDQMINLIFQ